MPRPSVEPPPYTTSIAQTSFQLLVVSVQTSPRMIVKDLSFVSLGGTLPGAKDSARCRPGAVDQSHLGATRSRRPSGVCERACALAKAIDLAARRHLLANACRNQKPADAEDDRRRGRLVRRFYRSSRPRDALLRVSATTLTFAFCRTAPSSFALPIGPARECRPYRRARGDRQRSARHVRRRALHPAHVRGAP